ncbi:MAG TPA: VIT1/CCC1 transporter family protein, partial [archaeon]|nr:VIT1/CCC1 transporter family protein [archaeon]
IKEIYFKKGFRGTMLNAIVSKLTSNKDVWVKVMMEDEMHLYPDEYKSPMRDALIVGFSALIGSVVPLIPFFLLPVETAIIGAITASIIILFVMGYIKGKLTTGKTLKSGVELAVIGMAAALAGYAIGAVLGVALYA